jgi:hypothetical protein
VSRVLTPEEQSKELVTTAVDHLRTNADILRLRVDVEDRDDYLVLYVLMARPSGRRFLMQVICDDYPRQPPLIRFVNPKAWTKLALRQDASPEFYPVGDKVVAREPLPVLCLRGQRDYYRDGWHAGWTNPPADDDALPQMITNVSIAVQTLWR